MSAREQFRAAIAEAGLQPPDDIIAYRGKPERFSTNGKSRDDSGWYVFYDDARPAGKFGDYRSGIESSWKAESGDPWTPEQKRQWAERMREVEAQRARDLAELQQRAADKAASMWAAATDASERGHPYLTKKQIAGLGARVLRDQLLIPMRHGPGALVGLQVVQPDGSRKFLTGTPAGGAYMVLGKPGAGPVAIVEGYATGVSVHMATQFCTVVAFSAGNLEAVARKIRKAMPAARLILGGDDDTFTDGNPGMTAASHAASVVNARVARPVWVDSERGRGTDFNDLHAAEGLEAVAQCFGEVEPPRDDDTEPITDEPLAQANPGADDPAPVGSEVIARAPAPPAVLDYSSWLPDHNNKGRPLATIENIEEISRRLGITIRYNVISKDEEIIIPGKGFSVDNRQNASFAWLESECAKFSMPTEKLGSFITYLADQNLHNPVANWIHSKPWDGVDRLAQLIATVRAAGEDKNPQVGAMKRAFITRWMISAVAAALRPNGVSAHGVLVFQGDQYIGKTKWFKTLVPAELGVLQDGVILRPEDRDSVKQCCSNWLVELGELDATFRKSDIAALKAFLTKDRDVLRRAYARKESEFARRTVFFASVNPTEFLHDHTGNRRYWTIACEHLDHSHTIDMQQCWAQVATLLEAGESWFLAPDEMDSLNDHNKAFEVVDPIEELIGTGLDWSSADSWDWRWAAASDVLRELGRDTPTLAESTRAAHVIRDRNGKKSRKSNGVRQLWVPPVIPRHNRH